VPTVLMVAFQFPPFAGSSAVQRTLRFVQHLPSHGWDPIVLTAHPFAYEASKPDLLNEIPKEMVVRRAPALDTARHLALFGRYPGCLARPDRWRTWQWPAVVAGLGLTERYRPAAIWSTFPIASAHAIASRLHKRTGLPWVADFRDPMVQDDYPSDPHTHASWTAIQNDAACLSSAAVFTTRGAASLFRQRYPLREATRSIVIENGFDEESFKGLHSDARSRQTGGRPLILLHSGVIYSSERDPRALFAALGQLKRQGQIDADLVRLRFRASGNDELLAGLAREHDVKEIIELEPALGYREALAEMVACDGLLVLQAANCNQQIPAKLYEYLRAARPILALTDADGDTAELLRRCGLDAICPLDSAPAIAARLAAFISSIDSGAAALPDPEMVASCTRARGAADLAHLLDQITSDRVLERSVGDAAEGGRTRNKPA